METVLARFLAGEILQDPFILKLLFYTIFFLGIAQLFKIGHSLWKTGKLKTKEKVVEEKKGEWKTVIDQMVAEMKKISSEYEKRNVRAEKIHDKIQWLYEVHHKFDGQGVPLWYSKQSLEIAIVKLSESIEKQTDTMGKISEELKEQSFSLRIINDNVSGKPA